MIQIRWNNGQQTAETADGEKAFLSANAAWNSGARDVEVLRDGEYLLRPGDRPMLSDIEAWG